MRKDKAKDYYRKYGRINAEAISQKKKEYYQKNKEMIKKREALAREKARQKKKEDEIKLTLIVVDKIAKYIDKENSHEEV